MLEAIGKARSEDAPVGTAITAAAETVGRATNEPVRIPKSRYLSPEFAALEQERMWPRVWQIACTVDHVSDAGAYAGGPGVVGPAGPPMIVRFITGPYRIAKAGGSSTTATTNTMRRGAYRGPWMFETVVREVIVDIAARRLGLDPLELRRRNLVQATDLPYTTAAGIAFDRITPAETDAYLARKCRALLHGLSVDLDGRPGPLTLTARLSKSGDAVAAKGDLEGTARGVAVGATDVKVSLDTVKE